MKSILPVFSEGLGRPTVVANHFRSEAHRIAHKPTRKTQILPGLVAQQVIEPHIHGCQPAETALLRLGNDMLPLKHQAVLLQGPIHRLQKTWIHLAVRIKDYQGIIALPASEDLS
jgi:hypothetical protein